MIADYIKDNKLHVVVKPNSPKTEIIGEENGKLKIAIKAVPDKNKANIALVKFLSKELKLSARKVRSRKTSVRKVRIISGSKSREKVLEII